MPATIEAIGTNMKRERKATSQEKVLGILSLFSDTRHSLKIEDLIEEMNLSQASVYRYVKALIDGGFVANAIDGSIIPGPRVIELDRLIRKTDPLLKLAVPKMKELGRDIRGVVLLCGLRGDQVICTHEERTDDRVVTSYERGRPMPLLRGATSKVILANLPTYHQKSLMLNYGPQIAEVGLGTSWSEFRNNLRKIRVAGFAIGKGELDKGVVGFAVPILLNDTAVASISIVQLASEFDEASFDTNVARLQAVAAAISRDLITSGEAQDGISIGSARRISSSGVLT